MSRIDTLATTALGALTLVLAGAAGAAPPPPGGARTLPFPLQPVTGQPTPAGAFLLEADAAALEALEGVSRVRFAAVEVAAGVKLDLELDRVRAVTDGGILVVDGVAQWLDTLDEGITLWSGAVPGDATSTAYLAFSRHGSRGLIHAGGRKFTLSARPRHAGDWSDVVSLLGPMATVATPAATSPEFCASEKIQSFPVLPNDAPPSLQGSAQGAAYLPIYEAEIALETDYQFYQLFNNLNAARAYAITLFGAVSDRYREQVGVIHTMPYLGLYTQNNDPWTEQDTGGNCIDVLYEFQAKWKNGNAPVAADLYTMYSGANLGCGVAWLDVLCNSSYGFSVCGNMGGNAQFPIAQGNDGNWDFMVAAHELGHNFATPHTHDYCPPIDRCAPNGYFGQCQNSQQCINYGTLMSYCHLCSGGLDNITTYFHPTPAGVMRTAIENSCMNLFKGITSNVDLGYALAGSNGVPQLAVSYAKATSQISFQMTKAPKSKPGIVIVSPNQLLLPFKGGTLVPALDAVIGVASNGAGNVTLSSTVSGAVSLPNGDFFAAQAWFNDAGGPNGVAATNAVEFEFIAP